MTDNRRRALSQPISILLDGIRFSAAMVVLIGHLTQPQFSAGWPDLSAFAVAAVGAFFVMSGLVIDYTHPRHPNWKDYARARLVRLWSVVIPALAYTAFADAISWSVNPLYYGYWLQSPFANSASLIADILFLNQSWGHDLSFGSNNPIWSLGYEAAYYALFGAFVYCRGRRRILIICVLLAVKGPQILMLFPIWLLGVVTCRILMDERSRASRMATSLLWLAGCGALVFFGHNKYIHDARFLFDNIPGGQGHFSLLTTMLACGLATSSIILLAQETERFWAPLALAVERPIRWLARSTFSIYLFHFPTLVLIQAMTGYSRSAVLPKLASFTVTVFLCIALSFVTERRKTWWDGPVCLVLQPSPRV